MLPVIGFRSSSCPLWGSECRSDQKRGGCECGNGISRSPRFQTLSRGLQSVLINSFRDAAIPESYIYWYIHKNFSVIAADFAQELLEWLIRTTNCSLDALLGKNASSNVKIDGCRSLTCFPSVLFSSVTFHLLYSKRWRETRNYRNSSFSSQPMTLNEDGSELLREATWRLGACSWGVLWNYHLKYHRIQAKLWD